MCVCMPVWSFLVVRSVFVYLPKVNMSMPERVCVREFRFGVVWGETAWTFSKDAAGTDCSNLHLLLEQKYASELEDAAGTVCSAFACASAEMHVQKSM